MITVILSVLCVVLLVFLVFIFLKIRSLYKDLDNYKHKLSLFEGEDHYVNYQINQKFNSSLKSVSEKSDQLKSDPLVSELTDTLKLRANFLSKMFVRMLESSQIILGISAGLFGMSVVAVIFHFMKYVGNHHTSELLESISYSVFFLFVTIGIASNNYLQRKIKREQEKLLKVENSFEVKLENLKAEYEAILDKSQKEQHNAILAKAKIADELSQLANQRQKEIASLASQSKRDKFFAKAKASFVKKPKSKPENK